MRYATWLQGAHPAISGLPRTESSNIGRLVGRVNV
jgi:hypothetical protein